MTDRLSSSTKDVNYLITSISVMSNNVDYIKKDINEIKRAQQNNYVTKDEFYPVKRAVYWMIGAMGAIAIAIIIFLLQKALA